MAHRATVQAHTGAARHDRRREVQSALDALGTHALRRSPPPEGRLGTDEDIAHRLRATLVALGPVFAGFGRYLSTRFDLVPRRTRAELGAIADEGDPMSPLAISALIEAQLGAPPERLFFQFHDEPTAMGLFTQRHIASLSPGVPVSVTLVRPEVGAELERDLPMLPLVAARLGLPRMSATALTALVDDYAVTLRRRLDQRALASAFATLAADARRGGGLDAPVCYRDHCAPNVLTTERIAGDTLDNYGTASDLAVRLTTAWLRQALSGSVVPYDFDAADVIVSGERLVLAGGIFEPHPANERARFAAYLGAVASDNPDAAATWLLDGANPTLREEIRLRRVLRQAVPFRDGEWSGDDRLIEHVLVEWRVAGETGWTLTPHHQHVFRGLHALARIANHLAPETDTLLAALESERMRIGVEQAGRVIDPRNLEATLDRAVRELVALPERLDDVLTRAAEGRLRTTLQVPETDEHEHARNRTVLLVTALVAFVALASVLRHVELAGVGVERIGAVLLLVLGGWLLIAAARL